MKNKVLKNFQITMKFITLFIMIELNDTTSIMNSVIRKFILLNFYIISFCYLIGLIIIL